MSEKYYVLDQDQDCHWYLVPSDKLELFQKLTEDPKGWADPEWPQFDEMRIDSTYEVKIISYELG